MCAMKCYSTVSKRLAFQLHYCSALGLICILGFFHLSRIKSLLPEKALTVNFLGKAKTAVLTVKILLGLFL